MMLPATALVLFGLFPLAMACAAASDLLTMTIPNRIPVALLVAFAGLAPVAGLDLETAGMHIAAGGAVLAATLVLFAFGWIGGGDAKLAAAIALWLGWNHAADFVLHASVFGGVLTLAILSFRQAVLPAFALRQPWVRRLHEEAAGVPYGLALAAAALLVYPDTVWIRLAAG